MKIPFTKTHIYAGNPDRALNQALATASEASQAEVRLQAAPRRIVPGIYAGKKSLLRTLYIQQKNAAETQAAGNAPSPVPQVAEPPGRFRNEASAAEDAIEHEGFLAEAEPNLDRLDVADEGGGQVLHPPHVLARQEGNQDLQPAQPHLAAEEENAGRVDHVDISDIYLPILNLDSLLGSNDSSGVHSYLSIKDLKTLSKVNRRAYEVSRMSTGPTPSLRISNRADLAAAVQIIRAREVEGRSIAGINLDDCHDLTDEDLRLLADLPSLKKVSLTRCRQITDRGLVHLANATDVNLTECDQITNAGLAHLVNAKHVSDLVAP